jgi:hypothetical protein
MEVLDTLEAHPGILSKQELLKSYMLDKDFCRVLTYALTPKKTYHIKKLPQPRSNMFRPAHYMGMPEVFSFLDVLNSQTGATDIQKLELAEGISNCPATKEIVMRILKGDLRCGVKEGLVNRTVPGFIEVWPYMRCRSHSEANLKNIVYPCIAQLKANGAHIDVKYENGELGFFSRPGRQFNFFGQLDEDAMAIFEDTNTGLGPHEGVYIGEGTVLDADGNTLDRATGNGIINKALKDTLTVEEASRIRLSLWEYVPLEEFFNGNSQMEYSDSWREVLERTAGLTKIAPIEHQIVENYSEAIAYYRDVKARKLEGLILKNFSGTFWSTNSGTPDQVKVKAALGEEYEAEFRLIRTNPGKEGTRFENGVGSIAYVSECGLISGNVGSGLSHKQRDTLTDADIEGTIATLRFDELVKGKGKDATYSLYAPRIVELFRDKRFADDLEYVQELTEG